MTMLEKVARAIAAQPISFPSFEEGLTIRLSEEAATRLARAALLSLKEVDEGTIAAGIRQHNECTDDGTALAACVPECVWGRMLDHILTGGAE